MFDWICNALLEWEKVLPCPPGYRCGLEEAAEAVGLDARAIFKLTGHAALNYFFPGSSAAVLAIDRLYDYGGTGDRKIVEILKACNWEVSQSNVDVVVNAIRNNQDEFKYLLQQGGIRHACNNTNYWGINSN